MYDETESQMLIRLGMRAMLSAVAARQITDDEAKRIKMRRDGFGEDAVWGISCKLDDGEVRCSMSGGNGSGRFIQAGIDERLRLAALDGMTTAALIDGML